MTLNDTDGVIVDAGKYVEAGLLRRIGRMMKGLSRPRDSREYKEALIDLERLSAPLTALLIPTLAVIVLIVVSAVSGNRHESAPVSIAQADEDETELTPIDVPEVVAKPDEPVIDTTLITDVATESKPSEFTAEIASNDPVSPKVNTLDTVLMIKSPRTIKSVLGDARITGRKGTPQGGSPNLYGNTLTEGAVMKALRWLKHTQKPDGGWDGCRPAMAGFALLTYLAHGETPSASPEFGDTVKKALEFLMGSIEYDAGERAVGFKGMDGNQYAFPIAAYALAEAYGMTRNPDIRYAAEKCLARIIENQSSTGGWQYKFDRSSNRDDTSLGGWCIQALKAGKMAGIHPDGIDECIKKAIGCLKGRAYDDKLGFKYTADSRGGGGLAGVGCLAMQLLGYSREPEVRNALNVMRDWLPSFDPINGTGKSPQYYCYYASQCKYQAGMAKTAAKGDTELWKKWNDGMKKLYPPTIVTLDEKIEDANGRLCEMGYWQNKDQHGGTRTMGTCLAALQLMVYYRYLPTTSLKATDVEVDINEAAKDASEVGVTVDI